MNNSVNRDNQATAALLFSDLIQSGVLHALTCITGEIEDFCRLELQDLGRPHDLLARDLRRRLRRLTRQLSDCGAPGTRVEGLYHCRGMVLSTDDLRQLCARAGMQVSGGDDNNAVVVYEGPVMSPRGITRMTSTWKSPAIPATISTRIMPVKILFPNEKESASLPYSFPHKLFGAIFLTKILIA